MRRELYRAREEVFWQEHAVMTDESCDMDEEAVQWVLSMCKDNFSGDGSFPSGVEGEGCDSVGGSLFSRVSSTVESSSTTSSSGDCSSTEHNSGGGDGDADSRGGAADEAEDEASVSSPARRTRRNSHLVAQSPSSSQSVDSAAGSSKELESIANSDNETTCRKRTRTKTLSFSETSATTPKRVLRNTITELEETTAGNNIRQQSTSEKPQKRRRRHFSFPNAVKELKEESDRETVGNSGEESPNSDAVSRETRRRFSRSVKASKKPEAVETEGEEDSTVKPEVDDESRKENDPLRPENVVDLQDTGNTNKTVKRKRSKSTSAMDHSTRNKQARVTDYLRRRSPGRQEPRPPRSPRTRANTKNSDSEEHDQGKTDSDVHTDSKRVPGPRSFSNGRETTSDKSCPHCKLQHDKLSKCSWRCKEGSHTAECEDNWNRRELRVRTFQSPKSRTRCSHVVSTKPHCCSSLMTNFCHATVT